MSSLKNFVLKKVFEQVLQFAFIAALPPSPYKKLLLCCISVHYFTTYPSYFMTNHTSCLEG